MPPSRRRPWRAALGCALCLLARPARADWGDTGVGGRLQWAGHSRLGTAATASLGLADRWSAYLEAGGELQLARPRAWRLRAVAGPTWLFDVLRWVPAATVAAGVEVGADGAAHLAALARGELRYFVGRRLTVQASAAARWGASGLAPELGVGLGWQT